jgi:hypothetical protein
MRLIGRCVYTVAFLGGLFSKQLTGIGADNVGEFTLINAKPFFLKIMVFGTGNDRIHKTFPS